MGMGMGMSMGMSMGMGMSMSTGMPACMARVWCGGCCSGGCCSPSRCHGLRAPRAAASPSRCGCGVDTSPSRRGGGGGATALHTPRSALRAPRLRSSLRPRLTARAGAATARMITEQPSPAPHGPRGGSHSVPRLRSSLRPRLTARAHAASARRSPPRRSPPPCVKPLAVPPPRSPSRRPSLHILVTASLTAVASSMSMSVSYDA